MAFTKQEIKQIRKLRSQGKTLKTIAERFKVSQPTINYHCKGIKPPKSLYTPTERLLLKNIGKQITRKELLKKTGINSANLGRPLKKLEEKGLVSIVSEHQTLITKL